MKKYRLNVELKRIENGMKRRNSFERRKDCMLKKASEISILCDSEVALIIFSSEGKLYEFGTTSILSTLEKYLGQCVNPQDTPILIPHETDQPQDNELLELKAKYEDLQRTQRHLLGEDLGSLTMMELMNLEGVLGQAKQRIQTKISKDHHMQTKMLLEQVKKIRSKIDGQGLPCPWINSSNHVDHPFRVGGEGLFGGVGGEGLPGFGFGVQEDDWTDETDFLMGGAEGPSYS